MNLLKNRIIVIVGAIIIMFGLMTLNVPYLLSVLITFVIILGFYIVSGVKRQKKRLALLHDQCDPEAFIERTNAQAKITGRKGKMKAYFTLDKVAGYCYLNKFDEAYSELMSIDHDMVDKLSSAGKQVYNINTIAVLFGQEKYEEAKELYYSQVENTDVKHPQLKRSLEYLKAHLAIIDEDDDSARTIYDELNKTESMALRKLAIILAIAQLDVRKGDIVKAKEGFNSILDKGYKDNLAMVIDAKEELKKLEELDNG